MKKSLLAVAIAALVPGAVMAQTNVTLFGVADVGVTQRKGDGNGSVTGLGSSLFSSSRFGVRGTEDLGGGLRAGFWLEAGYAVDNAQGQATSVGNQSNNGGTGLSFNRRSTASLMGGFGEVRLGRDYVPVFWNHTFFDPFGTLGVGAATSSTARILDQAAGGAAAGSAVTGVRASNSIGYFLPGGLGGLYGQVMYALGENASNSPGGTKSDGRYTGARIGYNGGAFEVAAGYGKVDFAAGDVTNTNLAGSFTLGPLKLMAQWNIQENKQVANGGQQQRDALLGATYAMGATTLRASFIDSKMDDLVGVGGAREGARRYTIGVSQALSKRTSLYAAYGVMDNKGNDTAFTNGRAVVNAGGKATGFDLGVAHSF
jgi:predicted porin